MMKTKNRVFTFIIAVCLLFLQCTSFLAFADGDTVTIKSADDFREFAKNCQNDTWSQNKTVILDGDVDLSEKDYTPAAYFSGTFLGQGYTISGVNLTESGSVKGLFRYIGAGASVKELNVKGNYFPSGTKSTIGGIAGENNGSILNCTFSGNVKGTTSVGGIAGINQGMISNCTAEGEIYGEHYVGGISGKNLGSIILSKNYAKVNTYTETVKLDIENINTDKLLSTENTLDITDIGGIAGYSSGIVQSCENSGSIGYEHVGYNVGGICGRQTGYLNGCTNSGTINGRKDVGGICGQAEPYTVLQYSKESLDRLSDELDNLDSILTRTLNSTKNSKALISDAVTSAKGYLNDAKDSVSKMADRAEEKANEGIDKANDTISDIDNFTSDLSALVDGLVTESDKISSSYDSIRDITDGYRADITAVKDIWDEADFNTLDKAMEQLNSAMTELSQGSKNLTKAFRRFSAAMGDTYYLTEGLEQLGDGVAQMTKALDTITNSLNEIEKILNKYSGIDKLGNISAILKDVSAQVKNISDSVADAKKALQQISGGLVDLTKFISKIDSEKLIESFDYIESGMNRLANAGTQTANAAKNLNRAWKQFKECIDNTKEITANFDERTDALSSELDSISDSLGRSKDLIKNFNDSTEIKVSKLDKLDLEERDNLSKALDGISEATDRLHNNLSDYGDILLGDLDDVKSQLSVIFDVMTDSADEIKNKSTKAEDYIKDVSEYDDSQKQGKISDSQNVGEVNGDLNVGGISGSMAVEYDFDPEDDVTKKGEKTINFLYTTKAVVSGCTNYGRVTARKNAVGGICGKQDLGMITNSLAKGFVKSESGSYAGGISGQSASLIRYSYSKANISGDNYIGGIAGEADRVYGCVGIANLSEYNEYFGSISGKANGKNESNFFVGDIGGIDNISYQGKAEQITIETLMQMESVPDDMKKFSLVFIADGKIADEIFFDYGESIPDDKIPAVPHKDDCYGVWDRDDYNNLTHDDTVTAEYDSYITSIEADVTRDNGLAAIVAEGKFSIKSKLKADSDDRKGSLESWNIEVTDTYDDNMKIHYLPKDGKTNVKVYVYDETGNKKTAKITTDGKYVVFDAPVSMNGFSVSRSYAKIITVVILILIGILLVIGAVIAVKKLILKKQLASVS